MIFSCLLHRCDVTGIFKLGVEERRICRVLLHMQCENETDVLSSAINMNKSQYPIFYVFRI